MKKAIFKILVSFVVGLLVHMASAALIVTPGDESVTVAVTGLANGSFCSVELAWGAEAGGSDPASWAHRKLLAILSAARPSITVPWPVGWGTDFTHAGVFRYDGVVPDISTYITNNLVAQWDTSEGATAAAWTDRVGGKTFSLVNATLADGIYTFADSSAYGSLDAVSSSALVDSGTNTLEAVFNIGGNGYAFAGTQKSKIILARWNSQMILSGNGSSTCLKCGTGYNTYSVIYDEVKSTYPPHIARYVDGKVSENGSTYWSIGGTQLWLARSADGGNSGATVKFCALRIYDRQLTAAEVGVNAALDGARFRNSGVATRVADWLEIDHGLGIVAAVTLSVLNGMVEGAGRYGIGQTVTVRAIPDTRTEFLRWEGEMPAGCSPTDRELEFVLTGPVTLRAICGRSVTVDAINREEGVPVSAVLSFGSDTGDIGTLYCAYGTTDGGDALAAWDHVQVVRAIRTAEETLVVPFPAGWGTDPAMLYLRYFLRLGVSSESVVPDGLIAYWDAIDNVGRGVHAADTNEWIDLVAGRAFALTNATISANAISFTKATDSYGKLGAEDTLATFGRAGSRTLEGRLTTSDTGLAICGPTSSGVMIAPWGGTSYTSHGGPRLQFSYSGLFSSAHNLAFHYTGSRNDGVQVDGVTPTTSKTDMGWGATHNTYAMLAQGGTAYPIACSLETIRFYDGEMTTEAQLVNRAVDEARYRQGITLGPVIAQTQSIQTNTVIAGSFRINASVPHGMVTGAGEHEVGSSVTLTATMEPGYVFYSWTGDLPNGIDRFSPTITFTADAHRTLVGFITMPWEAVKNDNGDLVAISNSVWRFNAVTNDEGITISGTKLNAYARDEGLAATLVLSNLQAHTGYVVTRLANALFQYIPALKKVIATDALTSIGSSVFTGSGCSAFEPTYLPSLKTLNSGLPAKVTDVPNLTALGGSAYEGNGRIVTFRPERLTMPLKGRTFYGASNLKGRFILESPSTTIPAIFLGNCPGVTNIVVNMPVTTVDSWAFYDGPRTRVIEWNVAAPTTIGEAAFGNGSEGTTAADPDGRLPQLCVRQAQALADFQKFNTTTATFVPNASIAAKYRTKAYGWNRHTVGWISSYASQFGYYHIWLVDGFSRGFFVRLR